MSVLVAMAWKSTLILGFALLILALMRSRPAAEKSAVARWSVLLLAAAPAIVFAPEVSMDAAWLLRAPASAGAGGEVATPFDRLSAFIPALYAVGVLAVVARVLLGVATLRRWVRSAGPIEDRRWQAAIAELSTGNRTRVLSSDLIHAPLSFGWLRPVILIDRATLLRPHQAGAILAHEAAHIARGDWIVLIGMHIAAAMFWFNPLVWIAKHLAEQYAEQAADQRALNDNDAAMYAQALLDCARGPSPSIAVGMSQGRYMRRRMSLILEHATSLAPNSWRAAMVVAPVIAFAACVSVVTLVAPARASAPALAVTALAVERAAPSVPSAAASPATPASLPISVLAPALADPLEVGDAQALTPQEEQTAPATRDPGSRSSASDAQRQRWEQNMRRHEARDERRRQRDQARENRRWLQTQVGENSN